MIQRWQPWKLSTGARTEFGKQISKMNAVKHGGYLAQARLEIKQLRRILSRCCRKILAADAPGRNDSSTSARLNSTL
jgi:hypothetical protein